MCSNRNATLPQLVFAGVSGGKGHLDMWLASLHSTLAVFLLEFFPKEVREETSLIREAYARVNLNV